MITFVCALWRRDELVPDWTPEYDASWVEKLYRGVARHYRLPFRFVCLTDREWTLDEPIEQVPFRRSDEGWMNMMECFRPDLADGRRAIMGLDTVIVGDITDICHVRAPFAATRNHHREYYDTASNAVVVCDPEPARQLWNTWDSDREHWREQCRMVWHPDKPSEMVFIAEHFDAVGGEFLTDLCPGQILSYSQEWRPLQTSGRVRYQAHPGNTERGVNTRVVYFHGATKPDNISDDFVRRAWLL